jgi:hypothetical protein
MIKYNNNLRKALTSLVYATVAIVLITSCSDENTMIENETAKQQLPVIEVREEADVASVTLSGVHTDFVEEIDCATCTFVVPDDMTVVDGFVYKLQPGSVVCLTKGRKLGEVEFVNMVGAPDQPITIATCNGKE